MNFFAISALINIIVLTILLIILLLKRKETKSIDYFNIFNLFALGWSVGYFFWQTSPNYNEALFWVRFLMFSAIWTAPSFLHFALSVAEKESRHITWIIIAYMANIPFCYLNFTSPLFISGLETKLGIPFFPNGGWLYIIFLIQWIGWMIWGLLELYYSWKNAYEEEAKKILGTLFLTTTIAIPAASINYFLWFNIPIPPVTTIIFSLYALTITLSLLKVGTQHGIKLFFIYSVLFVTALSSIDFVLNYYYSFSISLLMTGIMVTIPVLLWPLLHKETKHL